MKAKAPVPEELSAADRTRLWEWVGTRYPHLQRPATMRRLVDECLSYWGARGNPKGYTDWVRACQNWIVKDQKWADEKRIARPEMPQEEGPRDSDLAEVIQLSERMRK